MRLHEAVEKNPQGPWKVPGMQCDGSDFTIESLSTSIPIDVVLRTDWEVVEDEVIEVGDVVKADKKDPIFEGNLEVKYIDPMGDCALRIMEADLMGVSRNVKDLSFIRKGPKVHVFEGVELRRHGIQPDDYVAFHGGIDDYKKGTVQDALMRLLHDSIEGDGETYTISLTEERD